MESSEAIAASMGLPPSFAQSTLVTYRSVGIGLFGAVMRFLGMPLEKIALYMNSSQVTGSGQLAQAARLSFADGLLAPYRVVGVGSMTAWFLQYGVMGVAFQFFDQGLSKMLGVQPVWYGQEIMSPAPPADEAKPWDYQMRSVAARLVSPVLASSLESCVSNRAEVQRFFGPKQYVAMMQQQSHSASTWQRSFGHAYLPNAMRNIIMCQTSFLLTPITYKLYFPQEKKGKTSLFWYGLGLNVFIGNVAAITQQALWGRSLDYYKQNGNISYRQVFQEGIRKEGPGAFFTVPKWFSRVLMNAPAQGTLPWFYNEMLPLGERWVLTLVKDGVYDPFLRGRLSEEPLSYQPLQKRRSSLGSLSTAHPEFKEDPQVEIQRQTTKKLESARADFTEKHNEYVATSDREKR